MEIIACRDSQLLAALNREIQDLHHQMHPDIFKPYHREAILPFFEEKLADENVVAWVAKEQEHYLGYLLLFKVQVPENPFQYARSYVLIDQILVKGNAQNKGIGKKLMEAAMAYAKNQGIDRLEVNHWTLNEKARHFFKSQGFEYYCEKMQMKITSYELRVTN